MFLSSVYIKGNTTKNQLKPGILLPGHKTTCALEGVAAFQIQSSVPLARLIPGCMTVTAFKFLDHVKLHLCMTRSPSVLIGLSSSMLRSHQYLLELKHFCVLSCSHSWIWWIISKEAQCIFRNVGLFTSVGLLFVPRNVCGVKWSIEPAMLRQGEIKLGKNTGHSSAWIFTYTQTQSSHIGPLGKAYFFQYPAMLTPCSRSSSVKLVKSLPRCTILSIFTGSALQQLSRLCTELHFCDVHLFFLPHVHESHQMTSRTGAGAAFPLLLLILSHVPS